MNSIGTKLGYSGLLGWHFKLPGTEIGNGYIQCLTDEDCNLMVKTLPANRIAEVYITHLDGVVKGQSQVSSNSNKCCGDDRSQIIESYLIKKSENNKTSKFVETKINLDELR